MASGCCAGHHTKARSHCEQEAAVNQMPRSRVTLALVALMVLVIVMWLLAR